jgi:hypothetical protein
MQFYPHILIESEFYPRILKSGILTLLFYNFLDFTPLLFYSYFIISKLCGTLVTNAHIRLCLRVWRGREGKKRLKRKK